MVLIPEHVADVMWQYGTWPSYSADCHWSEIIDSTSSDCQIEKCESIVGLEHMQYKLMLD